MLVNTVKAAKHLPFLSSKPQSDVQKHHFVLLDSATLRAQVIFGDPKEFDTQFSTSVKDVTDADLAAYLDLDGSPKVSVDYLKLILAHERPRNYHDSHLKKAVHQFLCDRAIEGAFNWGQP